jgi:hypothetical protein
MSANGAPEFAAFVSIGVAEVRKSRAEESGESLIPGKGVVPGSVRPAS